MDLFAILSYSDRYGCYACGNTSLIKDWLGKSVGVIKDVKL